MKAVTVEDAPISKPIVIAAMQDMGNVGSIAIDFINKSLQTTLFRYVSIPFPNYVVDNGGYIDFKQEKWEYRYGSEGSLVVFGGGMGQPQTNQELYDMCQDVIDVALHHSAQLVYAGRLSYHAPIRQGAKSARDCNDDGAVRENTKDGL